MSSQTMLQPPTLIMTKLGNGYVDVNVNDSAQDHDHGDHDQQYPYNDIHTSGGNVPHASSNDHSVSVIDRSCDENLANQNEHIDVTIGTSECECECESSSNSQSQSHSNHTSKQNINNNPTITPRTSSLATFLSLGGADEQFHLDSDHSRSESFRSINSISASQHVHGSGSLTLSVKMEKETPPHLPPPASAYTPKVISGNIHGNGNNNNYIGATTSTGISISPNSCTCSYIEQEDHDHGYDRGGHLSLNLPQQDANSLELDPDLSLSMDSESLTASATASATASLSSPFHTFPRAPPKLPSPTSTSNINIDTNTDTDDGYGYWYVGPQAPSISSGGGGGGRTRKVHPIVYSAIGSLESVNHSNLGSFSSKLMIAATAKRGRQKQIKVDATTSHISKRITKGNESGKGKCKGKGGHNHLNPLTDATGVGGGGDGDGRMRHTTTSNTTMNGTAHVTNGINKFSELSSMLSSQATRDLGDSATRNNRKVSTLSTTLSSSNANGQGHGGNVLDAEAGSKHPVGGDQAGSGAAVSLENETTVRVSHTSEVHAHAHVKPIIKQNIEKISSPRHKKKGNKKKKVTIDSRPKEMKMKQRHVELFRPSCDAYTPRMGRKEIKYKPAEERAGMEEMSTKMGTIQRPNFKDALRRVAMIIQQHIVKIEQRFENGAADHPNLFSPKMRDAFDEANFVTPRYKCTITKLPMARAGIVYGMRKIRVENKIPSADDIYQFAHRLFKQVQLSSECSIICLIYVERLMETAKVPVMAKTWRPIFMCGLLLASKVWQDWSSWNIEFASVYPSFSLEAINKLELQFLKMVKWDLYISSSLYAKYYFALRSLLEKQDFRRKYVRMVGGIDNVSASEALKISKRSEMLKEKSLAYLSLSV